LSELRVKLVTALKVTAGSETALLSEDFSLECT